MDLKMVVWVNIFGGRQRRRRFCFRHTAGDFFLLLYPMCLYSKYSEFCGTSGLDLG